MHKSPYFHIFFVVALYFPMFQFNLENHSTQKNAIVSILPEYLFVCLFLHLHREKKMIHAKLKPL